MPNPLLASLSAAPGPHPTTGELRDYAAGTLPPAAQHGVEAHALACPRCADALAGWQLSAPAPADAALARLRGRLRERVQELEPLADEVPLPTTVPAAPSSGAAPWLGLRRWAAAAAVAGLSAVGVWAWQHREAAEIVRPEVAAVAPAPAATGEAASPLTSAENTAAAPSAPLAAPAAPGAVVAAKPARRPAQAPPLAAGRPVRPQPAAPVVAQAPVDATSAPAGAEAPAGSIAADASATDAAAPPTVAYNAPETSDKKQEASNKALKTAPAADQEDDRADRAATVADASSARARTARPAPTATAMPAPAPIGPAPVGGWLALRERLRRQAADFDPAENATRLTGTVYLRLLIGTDGKVQEGKILRGLRADYDAEALRLATEAAPRWQPGLANGRRAALPVELIVSF